MSDIFNLTDTWNNGATVFSAIKMNVTDTASDAASKLLDLQVAGSPKFDVRKDGVVHFNTLEAFASYPSVYGAGGSLSVIFTGGGISFNNQAVVVGEAANTLAQRNGTNAQTFNLYNTYTDASNNSYLDFGLDSILGSGVNTILSRGAGTGAGGLDLYIGTQGTKLLGIVTNSTIRWKFDSNGHQIANLDNTYDIGAATATRPRTIYAGTSILVTGTAGGIGYGTGAGGAVTQITSRTTGVTLNKVTGAITLVSAAGSAVYASFTVANSAFAATDVVKVCQKSGTDKYQIHVTAVGAGSFEITFATTGGVTTEQPVFNFAVIKAVTS